MLLGKIDRKFVQHFPSVAAKGAEKRAVTVHDNKSKLIVVLKELVERLGVKFVVAQVQARVDLFERLKVDIHFFLLSLLRQDRSAVHHEAVVRHAVVQFQPLLR